MNFSEVMDRMLPPSNGQSAVIGGEYGETRGSGTHGGVDFNYPGGQSGINLTNPAVYSPITGVVTGVGGTWGWVTIRDANGNSHEILHLDSQVVTVGQDITAGQQIGTMGDTAPYELPEHVHYQLKGADNELINPVTWWGTHDTDGNDTSGEGLPDEKDQPLLSDYEKYRALVKKLFTQAEGNMPTAYMDDRDNDPKATIGIGFNIEDNEAIRKKIFDVLNIGNTGEEIIWRAKLIAALEDPSLTKSNTEKLMTNLNKILQDRKDAMSDDNPFKESAKTEFKLTPEEIDKIFWDSLEYYEGIIDKFLYLPEREQNPDGSYPPITNPSNERAVLLSLAWLSVIKADASGSPTLRRDIQANNRADAWFQIRYDSNKPKSDGAAKRRYMEAQIFGLYADENNVSELEANQSVDNYLEKYTQILAYETRFQQMIDDADADLKAAHIKDVDGNLTVDSIGQIFKPIASYLYNRYVAQADAQAYESNKDKIDFQSLITGDVVLGHETSGGDGTFIQPVYRWLYNKSPVDESNLPAGITGINDILIALDDKGYNLQGLYGEDVLIGGAQADTLYGGYKDVRANSGDDVLIGGGGNDSLYGGDGNDVLRGGAGVDSYYFERNDGRDLIIDSDGAGIIYIKSTDTQTDFSKAGGVTGNLVRAQIGGWLDAWWETDAEGKILTRNRYNFGFSTEADAWILSITVDDVTTPSNTIEIINFRNGHFGLTLDNFPTITDDPQLFEDFPGTSLVALPPNAGRIFDPLTFDLNNDGQIGTRSLFDGVQFDLDNSGFAEKTSWVSASDGLLVLDRNSNGFIDGGAELFGSETILQNGIKAANGFEALAEFDSNHDQKIDSSDAQFNALRMWRDANSNGIADAGELQGLAAVGIASIDLAHTSDSFVDKSRVEHREQGLFTRTDSTIGITNTLWFSRDARQSVAVSELRGNQIVIPADILALPDAAGSGNLHSLRQAMVLDATGQLKQAVTQFVQTTDIVARRALVNTILLLWTNQSDVSPDSRGEFVNAQHLTVLEQFWGEASAQEQPSGSYGTTIEQIYQQLEQAVYSQLMQDSHAKALFDQVEFTRTGPEWHGDFTLVSQSLVNRFVQNDPAASLALQDFMEVVKGINPYDLNSLYDDFTQSVADAALTAPQSIRDTIIQTVRRDNDSIIGTGADEIIGGHQGNDTIRAEGGDDLLFGHDGFDSLYGEDGDDTLYGGLGNDRLFGGAGADTYHYQIGDGIDFIRETSGFDTIQLAQDINPSSIRLLREGNDLQIMFDENNSLYVVNMFVDGNVDQPYSIESIRFGNTEEWDLTRIKQELLNGRSGEDAIYGFDTDDVIVGGKGNDELTGYAGNDTYVYELGDGSDVVIDSAGVDKILLGAGITPDQVVLRRSSGNLIIYINEAASITIQGMFSDPDGTLIEGAAIESIQFSTNDVWDLVHIQQSISVVTGFDGDDFLQGAYSNDTFVGGRGDDVLSGGRGDDTYQYELGDGSDIILDEDGTDSIELGISIGLQDFNIDHVGDDLVLTLKDGGNITVRDAFVESSELFNLGTIEQINVGGEQWGLAKIYNETLKINGSWGDDFLNGTIGNDVFVGRGGNDLINGDAGDDRYQYFIGDGNDVIEDSSGLDIVDFGIGITPSMISVTRNDLDLVIAVAGSGTITVKNTFTGTDNTFSTTAIEYIRFSDNSAWGVSYIQGVLAAGLEGTDGNDVIHAFDTDDVLSGSKGNDQLFGYAGNDVYRYAIGDGNDLIIDSAGTDQIEFGEGILEADIVLRRDLENNLVITLKDNSTITVKGAFDASGAFSVGAVESIKFMSGNEWDGEKIREEVNKIDASIINGSSGNDTLTGTDANDIFVGAQGDDYLQGKKGDDRYVYNLGDGNDQITDESGIDEIAFGEGISPEDISLYRQGWYGLRIVLKDGGTILINNMFNSSDDVGSSAIEGIRFSDDAFWDSAQIKAKIIQNSITEDNDIVEGFSSSDVIEGDGGFDQLHGKGGDDRYIFNRGDGVDIITDTGGNDTLVFGPGIAPTDVTVHQSNGNFYFILNNGEMVQITGELIDGTPNETRLMERVEFAGEVVWDKTIIQQKIAEALANPNLLMGRDTWDHLYAGSNNSVINGLGGNDQIYGGDGNDTLTGGGGLNFLDGGKGDDTYLITEQPAINFIENFRDGFDRILFAEGIMPEDVSVRLIPGRKESHLENGVLWVYSFSQANNWNFEIKIGDSIVYLDSLLTSGALFGARVKDPSLPSGEVEFFSGTKWDVYGLLQQAVKGTAVNDYITGTGNNDVIDGLAGNDLLQALDGADTLDGGAGDDTLIGGYGKDVLIGGKGNDLLRGDNSSRDYSNLHESIDDVYRFNIGDGNDTIEEYFGRDTIEFGEGIAKENVIFTTEGNDIVVSFTNSIDSITIINGSVPEERFYDGGKIEIFTFANGDVLNFDPKLDPVFREGTANSDTLVGGFGNDTFIGHEGNDDLRGDLGDDEYRYNLGDGFDYIDESGGVDKIVFGSSISPDMVQIKKSGFTFDIYVNNQKALSFGYGPWTGNHTLEGNPDSLVESLVFANGDVWDLPTMVTKSLSFTFGNDVLYGTIADDVIDGGEGNDEIQAGSGNDTLIGGKGNDTLVGSIGDDEYRFEVSDGADVIYDYGGNDSIVFGLGITPEDISVNRYYGDLILKIKNANPITISDFFTYGGSVNSIGAIENFIFANGDQLSIESLLEKLSLLGTKNADIIFALDTDDLIDAKEGNDEVSGGDGNDTILGGNGNDTLSGNNGNDSIVGGSGNDSIGGSYGDDFLSGGIGNDVLYGDFGDDILEGGDGDDRLEDLYGDNIFEGGKGTDLIFTQYGNEGQGLGIATVRFGVGDGTDYLYGPASFNRIELGAGITQDSIFLKSQGKYAGGYSYQHENGFNLYIKGTSDKLFGLIDNDQFEIVFADNSVLKGAELSDLVNKSIVRLSSDRQSITGKSTPGVKIQVTYRNQDNSVTNYPELTADEQGNYSLNFGFGIKDISRISVIGLDSGSTVLPMTVFDPVTDTSIPSSPIAELDSSGYLISGFARPGTYVYAFGPDDYIGRGVSSDLITGAFTINSYRRLNNGQSISVVASVNTLIESAPTIITAPDVVPPVAPSGVFDSLGTKLLGSAEKGTIVSIMDLSGNVLGSSVANPETGAFVISFAQPIANGELIQMVARDQGGNSFPRYIRAPDVTAPTTVYASVDKTGKIIKGFAEPGSTVVVRDTQGALLRQVTASAIDGAFEVTLSKVLTASQVVNIKVIDTAGNASAIIPVTAGSSDSPKQPQVTIDAHGRLVSGVSTDAGTIIVRTTDNVELARTTVQAGISFNVTLANSYLNQEILSVSLQIAGGAESAPNYFMAPDKTAPAKPIAMFTSYNHALQGFAEPGSTVQLLKADNSIAASVIASGTNGSFTLLPGFTISETSRLSVIAIDSSGNVSSPLALIPYDNFKPIAPTANFNSSGKIVTGTAEPDTLVYIEKNISGSSNYSVIGFTRASINGTWVIELEESIIDGTNIYITSVDAGDNRSNVTITSPDLTAPLPATAIFDTAGKIITGTAEYSESGGNEVIVMDSTNTIVLGRATLAAYTSTYKITLVSALTNNEIVNVFVKDLAGNLSYATAINAPDKTAPAAPTATIDSTRKIISGEAEAGATVQVKNSSGAVLGSIAADAVTGAYSITLGTVLAVNQTVNVTAKDLAGNISSPKAVIATGTADTIPPAIPSATFDSTGTIVSGNAEPGSVVIVKNANNTSTLGTVIAHATSGAYSITLASALINKETVNITATDAAGNVSVARALIAPDGAVTDPTAIIIQAENYTSMSGVKNETTNDVGGGQNTGWIDTGDWMAYTNTALNVPAEGRYRVTYRVASLNGGGRLTLKELSTDAALGSISIPKTSGWQKWVDVTQEITLSGGEHNFKLAADVGGFNINWFKLELLEPIAQDTTPPAQPTAVFDPQGKVITGAAEAGSVVVVKDASNANTLGTVTADEATGAYAITLGTALINNETINISATDAAGNISAIKAIIAPDKTAPTAPSASLDVASKTVSGIAENGSSVVVKDSAGQTLGVVQANSTTGAYSVSFTQTLVNGQSLFTTATDTAGNISAATATPIVINADPLPTENGLRGRYYGYHQPANGNVNLTNVAQVKTLVSNKSPDASFIAKNFQYGVAGANELGMGTTLQTFLRTDAPTLNVDPANTSDAILRFDGKIQLDAGSYNFRVRADDGYSIMVNGAVVAEYSANQAATTRTHAAFTITQSGLQDIEIVYWDAGGGAFLNVELADTATGNYAYLNESILFQPSIDTSVAMIAETNKPKTDYEGVNYYSSNDALIQAMASFVSESGVDTRYRATHMEQGSVMIAVGG